MPKEDLSSFLEKTEEARRKTQKIFNLYGSNKWKEACVLLDELKQAEREHGNDDNMQSLLALIQMSTALVGLEMTVEQLIKIQAGGKNDNGSDNHN